MTNMTCALSTDSKNLTEVIFIYFFLFSSHLHIIVVPIGETCAGCDIYYKYIQQALRQLKKKTSVPSKAENAKLFPNKFGSSSSLGNISCVVYLTCYSSPILSLLSMTIDERDGQAPSVRQLRLSNQIENVSKCILHLL
jgi:hypothetical protein